MLTRATAERLARYKVVVLPLSLALSLALAVLLNRRLAGIALFRTAFFLPSVTNMVAVSVLWLWIFNPEFGLLNALLRPLGIDGPLCTRRASQGVR